MPASTGRDQRANQYASSGEYEGHGTLGQRDFSRCVRMLRGLQKCSRPSDNSSLLQHIRAAGFGFRVRIDVQAERPRPPLEASLSLAAALILFSLFSQRKRGKEKASTVVKTLFFCRSSLWSFVRWRSIQTRCMDGDLPAS